MTVLNYKCSCCGYSKQAKEKVMPNKEAKSRKREKNKKNTQLNRMGRTANQVKKRRLKDSKRSN